MILLHFIKRVHTMILLSFMNSLNSMIPPHFMDSMTTNLRNEVCMVSQACLELATRGHCWRRRGKRAATAEALLPAVSSPCRLLARRKRIAASKKLPASRAPQMASGVSTRYLQQNAERSSCPNSHFPSCPQSGAQMIWQIEPHMHPALYLS